MPKRQSSRKASTIAGRFMRTLRAVPPSHRQMSITMGDGPSRTSFTLEDLLTLAACVLAQDETKGQAPKKRKAKGASK